MVKEIAIMRILQDHPNTVKLIEVFEDAESYMLVMELCTGGELFDQIIQKVSSAKGRGGVIIDHVCFPAGLYL